jgi:menaquinone-specific isochorismate synthase
MGQDARSPTENERKRLLRLHSEKIEAQLDSGQGECHLRNPEIARLVTEALGRFEGQRYELHEWCVMPNHVHVVLRPLSGHSLAEILHSWKSYTAKVANRRLGRSGDFWQVEYYDHLIRDEADYAHAIDYVRQNPEKAGLISWPWRGHGRRCESGTGVPPVGSSVEFSQSHGRDARATLPEHDDRGAVRRHEVGDYRASVAAGLERIAAGEFQKIVLARAQDIVADEPLHPLRMLNGLRQRFPDCYAFSSADGSGRSFIGASPERLVRVSQGVLQTEALAGSARRGAGASEDAALAATLLHSEKDLREQRHVLDSIKRRLDALGLSARHPEVPSVLRLANVQHLRTPIEADLREDVRLLDVVAALHPTPAVGGSPREAAVARIRELEGFPRGLYAGALGWMNARGGGEFFVGIRSALVEGPTARAYAGAGIVAGSSPDREYAETELKFAALLDALLGT